MSEYNFNELKEIMKILTSAYTQDEIESSSNPDLDNYPTRLGRLLGNVGVANIYLKLVIEHIERENIKNE
jgi:hypothetical protein